MLKVRPNLRELNTLIDKVPDYPVSAAELMDLAADYGTDQSIIEFYESFPSDEAFTSKEDLITRTEQVSLMMDQEDEQPTEFWHASEED